jgi:hypothetical protein
VDRIWNDRIVSPSAGQKPLQIKANWRVHRNDCRDSQPDLMRNWGRRMAVGLFCDKVHALKSAREINLLIAVWREK